MSTEDRERWEERHRKAAALTPLDSVRMVPHAAHSLQIALDVACGQGRHSVALARMGYLVVAMDVSLHALEHLRSSLSPSGSARVLAVQADADLWPFSSAQFDVIVQSDFLDRRLFGCLQQSLRPGGLLLIDTFLDQGRKNAHGPSRPEFLLAPSELPRAFEDFELVHYAETQGDTARATYLGRKH